MATRSLEQKIDALTSIVEKGFAAVADDISRVEKGFAAVADDISRIGGRLDGLATKDQVFAVQAQVNSIERQLRETKMEVRLANLEDEVFGASKARTAR